MKTRVYMEKISILEITLNNNMPKNSYDLQKFFYLTLLPTYQKVVFEYTRNPSRTLLKSRSCNLSISFFLHNFMLP